MSLDMTHPREVFLEMFWGTFVAPYYSSIIQISDTIIFPGSREKWILNFPKNFFLKILTLISKKFDFLSVKQKLPNGYLFAMYNL